MSSTMTGSTPLSAFDSSSSGGSVAGTGLSSSPLQSYDSMKDGLDCAEHEESAAQLAVRRYSGQSCHITNEGAVVKYWGGWMTGVGIGPGVGMTVGVAAGLPLVALSPSFLLVLLPPGPGPVPSGDLSGGGHTPNFSQALTIQSSYL